MDVMLRCEKLTARKHQEQAERSIADCFIDKKVLFIPVKADFDGFVEKTLRISSTCLIKINHKRFLVSESRFN